MAEREVGMLVQSPVGRGSGRPRRGNSLTTFCSRLGQSCSNGAFVGPEEGRVLPSWLFRAGAPEPRFWTARDGAIALSRGQGPSTRGGLSRA